MLILGGTRMGKSVLMGAMVAAATGIPGMRIVWLDIDKSSWVLGHALNGTYQEPGAPESPPLWPFMHLDDPDGLTSALDWSLRLCGRWQITCDEAQTADLTRALEHAKSQQLRTMTLVAEMVQDRRLRAVLRKYYAGGGTWGHIFNGSTPPPNDNLLIYELRTLISLGDRAYAPAIELILNEALIKTRDNLPLLIYVDEAKHMLTDPVSRKWLHDGIRQLGKKNAGIIMATQALADIVNSPDAELLLESCPLKIFLPNPEARGEFVRNIYLKLGLSEHEIDIITNATPKQQYYFHSAYGRRLFSLNLGPIAQRYIANTSRIGL
jgi:type IV secretion system protein TrbE